MGRTSRGSPITAIEMFIRLGRLESWSHSRDKIVYGVAAVGEEGKYNMYMMNADCSDNHNVTPEYFAVCFLCYLPTFSLDDSEIYFTGQGYE